MSHLPSSSSHLPSVKGLNGSVEAANGRDYVSLSELESNYHIVDVDVEGGYILATPQKGQVVLNELAEGDPGPGSAVSQGEISGSGATAYRRAINSDYHPEMSGRQFIENVREMRNDAAVRTSLRIAKTPILSARWFMEPASHEDPMDIYRAKFVWKNLTQWMSISWPQFLIESMLMLDYGVKVFEKVFDIRVVPNENGQPEPRVVWQKFAPRATEEIEEFVYDDDGGPASVSISTETDTVDLDIWKALIFTFDKESGDLWGHSVLRSAYKHWYYKEQLYKIDAIQKERHGIGIPIITLPMQYDKDKDVPAAHRIGRNLRTNEEAHVVAPPGWEISFLKLEGQRIDALESAEHHKALIYENVLANFMVDTAQNASDAEIKEHLFTRGVRFTAEILRDVLNKYAIPQLMLYNWTEEEMPNGYPQLKVRRLGDERDWRVISFALRNLVGAGIVRPDDPTEAWIREELDMPVADPATARQIVEEVGMEEGDPDAREEDDNPNADAPRSPGRGSTPHNRQSNAGNMRQAQSPGSSRTGTDSSGTSGTS